MKKIKYLILGICAITFGFSIWKYIIIVGELHKEKEFQNQLIQISGINENNENTEQTEQVEKINFAELSKVNSDIVAWINIEGTNINYPVVQTNNNTYYLKHSFSKKYSNYGAIYMDATANKNFMSKNTFIYGHYTRNKSMFGELGNYMKQSFFEQHPYVTIYTPEKILKVEIFSVHVDSAFSYSYQMNFITDETFKNYINLMVEKSVINSDVKVDHSTDRIITFFSCSRETNSHEQDRYYIHGKIIELDNR